MQRPMVVVLISLAMVTLGLEIMILMPRSRPPARPAAWVEESARRFALQPSEIQHERISWAADLSEALALARQQHRLVAIMLARGDLCSGRI